MDTKNKKILAELLSNSRIPVSKLAKNVGVSREVALYRLNKLIKDKIKTNNIPAVINGISKGIVIFVNIWQGLPIKRACSSKLRLMEDKPDMTRRLKKG